jgi:hypothetical protein
LDMSESTLKRILAFTKANLLNPILPSTWVTWLRACQGTTDGHWKRWRQQKILIILYATGSNLFLLSHTVFVFLIMSGRVLLHPLYIPKIMTASNAFDLWNTYVTTYHTIWTLFSNLAVSQCPEPLGDFYNLLSQGTKTNWYIYDVMKNNMYAYLGSYQEIRTLNLVYLHRLLDHFR